MFLQNDASFKRNWSKSLNCTKTEDAMSAVALEIKSYINFTHIIAWFCSMASKSENVLIFKNQLAE